MKKILRNKLKWNCNRLISVAVLFFLLFFFIGNSKKNLVKIDYSIKTVVSIRNIVPKYVAPEETPYFIKILKDKTKPIEITVKKREPKFKINYMYMENSTPFKQNIKINVKGLMLHSVATAQESAIPFINAENVENGRAAVHAFIQANGNVYITLPILEKAGEVTKGWHSGNPANNFYVGIEMCEPYTVDYDSGWESWKDNNPEYTKEYVKKIYEVAVDFFAYLCYFHNLNPDCIISHKEGADMGIATEHGDPEHLLNRFNIKMDDFREDVNKSLHSVDFSLVKK